MHAYNVFYALLPPGNLSPANTFPSQLHFLFLFLLLNNPLSPVSTAYHTWHGNIHWDVSILPLVTYPKKYDSFCPNSH